MTKMPDTDPTPKSDRDPEQERVIQLKKEAQAQRESGKLDSDAAEVLDAFVTKDIQNKGA